MNKTVTSFRRINFNDDVLIACICIHNAVSNSYFLYLLLIRMLEDRIRSDLFGGTTSRILKVLSLLLIAMTEKELMRQERSSTEPYKMRK